MAWAVNHRAGKSCLCTVYKLSLAASIYWIWRERNKRIFQGQGASASSLSSLIIDEIRACLCSWRGVKPCDTTRLVARTWCLSSRFFDQM
ncbi:hypothetical protein RHMOL_Rhmol01G0200700 [Rhododendron molle]|nr:hypothetical protein RHMOL_Rhmol01G0200700 [Rhododendron molle]